MDLIFKILSTLGFEVSEDIQKYYSNIQEWQDWWKGYVPKFHKYTIKAPGTNGRKVTRKQMRMAKKVCEDWADLLLNDKTRILVDTKDDKINSTQIFLTGDENEQNGGVFGASKFWKLGNRAIEREFAQGTVCFYIQLTGAGITKDGKLAADGLKIKAIKDAKKIIPLSYEDDEISEIALASTHTIKGKKVLYLQIFTQEDEGHLIENYWFEISSGGQFQKIPAPHGEAEKYRLPAKPFVILKPNLENNIAEVPLGMSVYANALDNLQGCDLAYDNLYMDTLLGKKKVFMNQAAVSLTPVAYAVGDDGRERAIHQEPDIEETLEKSLYVSTGEKLVGDDQFFQEFNPALRVDENKENIQFNLNLLSAKVGLGQRRYSFDAQAMATATEVRVSNKDQTESVWKQRVEIQDALTELTRSILIIGKEKCGADVDPDAKITIQFDDTMFSDEEAERLRMLQEISAGVAQRWEYRVKYYGESEEEAREITGEVAGVEPETMDKVFFGKGKGSPENVGKEGAGAK